MRGLAADAQLATKLRLHHAQCFTNGARPAPAWRWRRGEKCLDGFRQLRALEMGIGHVSTPRRVIARYLSIDASGKFT